MLCEIDEPGEYYLDRTTGILYFWPPEPITAKDTLVVSLINQFVSMDAVSYVKISGA